MPWELLPEVHWRHVAFSAKIDSLRHLLLAELICEPIFMIYAMGIVARSTLEIFLSSENYILGVWKAISMSKIPKFGHIF